MSALLPTDCIVARAAVSALLDGELPEVEEARLRKHVRDCVDCGTFAEDLHSVRRLLQTADPLQPSRPLYTPRPQRAPARFQAAAAVAVIAIATGSAFALGRTLGGGAPAKTAVSAVPQAVMDLRADSMRQHLLAMLGQGALSSTHRAGRVIAL